jgi:hypothetical protein
MLNRRIVTVLFAMLAVIPTRAVLISEWTFETSYADVSVSITELGFLSPEAGNGTVFGHHTSVSSTWSSSRISRGFAGQRRGFVRSGEGPGSFPEGNGSSRSFNLNAWAVGDYFEFQLSTVGYQDLAVSWDQTRSSTGPATFDFAYSLNGSSFTIAANNYAVPAIAWSSGRSSAASHFAFDLSRVAALDNAPTVYFRLMADSAPSDTAGSSRIDNFTLSGIKVPDSSPGAAGWVCLLVLLGLAKAIPARPVRA